MDTNASGKFNHSAVCIDKIQMNTIGWESLMHLGQIWTDEEAREKKRAEMKGKHNQN